jgi:hypothetical protein
VLFFVDSSEQIIDADVEGVGQFPQILEGGCSLSGFKMGNGRWLQTGDFGEIRLAQIPFLTGLADAILKFG